METSTNLGRVSIVPRGEYDPLVGYERLDLVRYEGSGYLVLRPVQGVTPIDGQDYMLVAERGGTGEQGPAGATGSQGPQGEKGDTGDEGPAGPKGDMGPVGPKGDTGETGPQGAKGDQGDAGVGVQNITRTSGTGAAGTTDTYTITMTDGSTSTFQVYNGADGTGAGDMTKSVYDPQGKNTDIFAYADNGLSTKQNALTGQPGQVVGFNAEGKAVPQDAPATGVTTFNGRTGAVVPQTGDYTADDIMMPDGVTTVSAALSQKAAKSAQETVEKTTVPYRTVNLAASELPAYIASLPRLLTERLYVKVSGSMTAPSINFDGFYGSGDIQIVQMDGDAVFETQMILNGCSTRVLFNGIHFQCPDTHAVGNEFYGVWATYCKSVQVNNCSFSGGTHKSAYTALNCSVGTMMQASNIRADNCGTVALASKSGVLAFGGVDDADALHDNVTGAYTYFGGVITLFGNTPDTLGGMSNLKQGGIIARTDGTLL